MSVADLSPICRRFVAWCILLGCAPAAEAAYTAALLRCVDKAETITESRACRAYVNDAYRVDGGK